MKISILQKFGYRIYNSIQEIPNYSLQQSFEVKTI